MPVTRGLRWMMVAQACFAWMNVCTRLGARYLPWAEIAAVRFLLGAALAAGLAAATGRSLRVIDRAGAWRRSVFGTLAALGSFYALGSTRVGIGDAATLGATSPIFVALLSRPLLGERVGRHVALTVALAFAGILAIVRPAFALAWPVALVATAGAFCFALAMIWLRRIGRGETHEAIVLHFSLVGLLTMVVVALPVWRWPGWPEGLALLGAGLGGGGAQLAMTRAYSIQRAAPVSAVSNLGVVFTYLLAIPFFGELPTAWQIAGASLVIGATVLLAADR